MLPSSQREFYETSGYLVLPAFFSCDEIREVAEDSLELLRKSELIHADNLRCRWQSHLETGEAILDTLDPVIDLSEKIERVAKSPKLLQVLSELYGEPAFLFKDKLIFKPSGALGHAPHQDYISWPGFPESFTTVLVAIDEATEQNGWVKVYSGHHTKGYLSARDGDYHDLAENLFDKKSCVPLALRPGDIAIFGAFLPHGSSSNLTDSFRRHLYLSYNASSDGGEQRKTHYQQFHQWLSQRYAEYGYKSHFFK